MKLFEVRAWNRDTGQEFIVQMSLEDICSNPTPLNMADVGIILLNEYRKIMGLQPIDPSSVAYSIEDLRKTGRL
jgi:hypothetical protein